MHTYIRLESQAGARIEGIMLDASALKSSSVLMRLGWT